MEYWELSGEKKYAMAIFQSISIIAYISSFLIFTISLIMFQNFDELSIKIAGIFFMIGAVFAAMEAFIICSLPISFYLKEEDEFNEEDIEKIQKLMDEFEILDKEEDKN